MQAYERSNIEKDKAKFFKAILDKNLQMNETNKTIKKKYYCESWLKQINQPNFYFCNFFFCDL